MEVNSYMSKIIYLFTQDFKLLLFFQLAGRHLEYSEQVGSFFCDFVPGVQKAFMSSLDCLRIVTVLTNID